MLDSIGQVGVDPGTEWGTGLTSTADNTLRRKATVTAGDPNGADAFDPAAEWDGFADRHLRRARRAHRRAAAPLTAVAACGAPSTARAAPPATPRGHRDRPDDTVVDLADGHRRSTRRRPPARSPVPRSPRAGRRAARRPRRSPSTRRRRRHVRRADRCLDTDADAADRHLHAHRAGAAGAPRRRGAGPADLDAGPTDRSPLAPRRATARRAPVRRARRDHPEDAARTVGRQRPVRLLPAEPPGAADGDPTTSDGIFVFMGAFTTLIGGYAPSRSATRWCSRAGCRSSSTSPSSPAPRWSR